MKTKITKKIQRELEYKTNLLNVLIQAEKNLVTRKIERRDRRILSSR